MIWLNTIIAQSWMVVYHPKITSHQWWLNSPSGDEFCYYILNNRVWFSFQIIDNLLIYDWFLYFNLPAIVIFQRGLAYILSLSNKILYLYHTYSLSIVFETLISFTWFKRNQKQHWALCFLILLCIRNQIIIWRLSWWQT